jgi:hypothetical protein
MMPIVPGAGGNMANNAKGTWNNTGPTASQKNKDRYM